MESKHIVKLIRTKKSSFWLQKSAEQKVKLFRQVASQVPAYHDFLKRNKINALKVNTLEEFKQLPQTDKKNYLRKYPLPNLCWEGTLEKPIVFTATSGSTGEPFYFPRESKLDWEYSVLAELFASQSSNKKSPTLVIVCFGMGVWIGGVFTYQAFELANHNLKNISIITPGINKKEIFNALRLLAPQYEQVILAGYPPFIKDIIDEAEGNDINLKKLGLRLLFAAETFTEAFRDYLVKNGGIKSPYLDTLNIYGSADLGAMAYETPVSILIRRLAMKNQQLFESIFSPIAKTPTLAQYNPLFINFESENGEILVTANNTVPLIRYAIGDSGGTFTFNEMYHQLKLHGIDLRHEAQKAGIGKYIYELPFVFVYERKDFSTTLYGLQVYPEHIREALLGSGIDYLTGRFTLITKFNKKQNQFLEIDLELKQNKKITPRLKKRVLDQITTTLLLKNSEFRELHRHLGKRALPKLVFWTTGHPLHFAPGIKQKLVKK